MPDLARYHGKETVMSQDITVTPRRVSRTRRVARWVGRAFIEWGETIGEGYYWQT